MVGAGAVVTRSVPANAIVVGNPARIVGYVERRGRRRTAAGRRPAPATGEVRLGVRGVTLERRPVPSRTCGATSRRARSARDCPFVPRRYFIVHDVPSKEVRGEHAHRRCTSCSSASRGSVAVLVDDGSPAPGVRCSTRPSSRLHVPPMIWGVQYKYTPDAAAAGARLGRLRPRRLHPRLRAVPARAQGTGRRGAPLTPPSGGMRGPPGAIGR